MAARESVAQPVPLGDGETIPIKAAAHVARVSPDTVTRWCRDYGIGRQMRPGTPWRVSVPALQMLLACDDAALDAFRSGNRTAPEVVPYLGGAS